MNGLVKDFMTGRMVQGFIEDSTAPGKYLCNFSDGGKYCLQPTNCHEYATCWAHTPEPFRTLRAEREAAQLYDREFMRDLKIANPPPVSSSRLHVEIVMQGAMVRKAREMHAMCTARKSLMGERRSHGAGEIYLGEIS
jgi:hypothetical protein